MMTRLQIEEGLIAAKSLAESVATLIDKALDEIGDDEHADWTEADAGVALAMHDLQQLSAVTIGTPDHGDLTLADLHHELMRRVVEAAASDEPQHVCELVVAERGGEFVELPEDSFKASGTRVRTVAVVVDGKDKL